MLDEEIKYFDEHWEEWEATYPGKYVLIKGTTLHGVYNSIADAVADGLRRLYPGPFLARPLSAHEREVHDAGIVLGAWDANPSCRIDR